MLAPDETEVIFLSKIHHYYRHMFETLVMADRISNYATVSGFIVGLCVLLFVVRSHRLKEPKTTISSREEDKGRKVGYSSDGPFLIDLVIIDMSKTLIQQALNWEGGVVFIPLAFGLAVGLGYVLISAARHKKGT